MAAKAGENETQIDIVFAFRITRLLFKHL